MTREEILLLKFGTRVQELREQQSMTLLDLAERSDRSIYELAQIEAGELDPLFDDIIKIVETLGVTMKEFFNFDAWQRGSIALGIYPYTIIKEKRYGTK